MTMQKICWGNVYFVSIEHKPVRYTEATDYPGSLSNLHSCAYLGIAYIYTWYPLQWINITQETFFSLPALNKYTMSSD